MNQGPPPHSKSFDYDPINDTGCNEQTWIAPLEAIPGKFYDSPKWGRVLCCGTADPEQWIPAFAVRIDGETELRFLHDRHGIALSPIQAWDNQPEEKPEPKVKKHFLHNTLLGGDLHGKKPCNPQLMPLRTTCGTYRPKQFIHNEKIFDVYVHESIADESVETVLRSLALRV
jgi:hypothetical protein